MILLFFDFSHIGYLKSQLALQYRLEEEDCKAKSRVLWLQCGDKNTRFFHEKTKQRRNFNRILSIRKEEGILYQKQEDVYVVAENYFSHLFTSNQGQISPSLLQGILHTITTEMNNILIYNEVFSINPEKALGADGLNQNLTDNTVILLNKFASIY